MKKNSFISRLFAIFGLISIMIACSGQPNTPGETAKLFGEKFAEGDIEGALTMIVGFEEAKKEEKEKLQSLFEKAYNETKEKHQGVKSIEIVEEKINEAGDKATVTLKTTFNDGTTKEDKNKLVKVDGKWKMTMNK